VLLIPYLLNEATTAVFPLKVFEYLATGNAVVSTALPSLLPYEPVVRIGRTREEFLAQMEQALLDPPEKRTARRALARRHTWEHRLAEIAKEIHGIDAMNPADRRAQRESRQ
jgi:hypothetical protein